MTHDPAALVVTVAALPAVTYALDLEKAAALACQEKAQSTRRVYRTDFRIFSEWCTSRGVDALPASPESVAAFLAHEIERGIKPSTLGHRVAAVRHAHKLAGCTPPTDDERVKSTMRGARRAVAPPPSAKRPLPPIGLSRWRMGPAPG